MNSSAIKPDAVMRPRPSERQIAGMATSDGAGVKLVRVLGQELQPRLDPFLLLDAFNSDSPADYIAGFPDHPHRGFETVTYLIAGRMRHRDSAGHEGVLESGGMQWMTAGRGVVHAEMPEQEDGLLEGFQLWLNLPARDKMMAPGYRDIQGPEIPRFTTIAGVKVRVLAGSSHGVAGAMQRPPTEPLLLDLHLPAGSRFTQFLPPSHNACLYVYRGEVRVGGESVPVRRMAILANPEDADGVLLQAEIQSRVILIAGRPLHEPIVQHGPFVMNTQEEIMQAIHDFKSNRFTSSS